MTIIKDRYEFGNEVNFGKNPVVYIDATNKDEYGVKGAFVRVDMGEFKSGKKWLEDSKIRFYMERDGRAYTVISPRVACLSATFGYSDVIECAKYATTPIIKTGDEVVFIIDNPNRKQVAVAKCKMGRTIKHCQDAMQFADKADSKALADLVFAISI
jgi:hypothetical protein